MYVYVNCHTAPRVTARCGGMFRPTCDRRQPFEFRNVPWLRYLGSLKGEASNYILEGSEKMNFIVYGKLYFLYEGWNLIVATIYLQLIQNRYMFRSFTVLHCSHRHCVQPVASDVEVVGYL